MIKNYFCVPIGEYDFDCSKIDLDYKLHKQWRSETPTSFKNTNNLSSESADYIKNILKKYITNFFPNFKSLDLNEFWINEYGYKDYQEEHNHMGYHFSFAIFKKIPKNSGDIYFISPVADLLATMTIDIFSYGYQHKGKENSIIIFPAFLKHAVSANNNKTEKRITYSGNFNIIK